MIKNQNKKPKSQTERRQQASQNLENMLRKIAPFSKPIEIEDYSTTGKWQVTTCPNNKNFIIPQAK